MREVAEFFRTVSLWGVLLGLLAGCLAATELGGWLGRRARRGGDESEKGADGLAAASLGLFALLIAFTYSLSLGRYDARRHQVLEEANAVGTAANYARNLPAANRGPVLQALRSYMDVRIGLGAPFDDRKFARDLQASSRLQGAMWAQAVKVTDTEPQSLPTFRFVAALNDLTNVSEARVTALRTHDPPTVLVMLIGVALVAMGFSGYASGLSGVRRRGALVVMSATLSLLAALTLDLDRPDRGTITISVQPLLDARAQLPPQD